MFVIVDRKLKKMIEANDRGKGNCTVTTARKNSDKDNDNKKIQKKAGAKKEKKT